jgi:hypothetical protein
MIRYLHSLFFILAANVLFSQDCSVGAVSYSYDNNEDVIFTYCPDNPANQVISVTLLDYAFETGYDLLTIYDGNGTSGKVMATIDTKGTSGYSYIGTSAAHGGDGCITFRIESDNVVSCTSGEVSPATWNVTCQTICNPPKPHLSAYSTEICATSADNQINPELVTFYANGSTHADGSSFTHNDTIPDEVENGNNPDSLDTDNDGTPDYQDEDSDNDSIPDEVESDDGDPIDTDDDGIPDYQDEDADGDGILDEDEAGDDPNNPVDTDDDGDPDFQDPDSDDDGIDDVDEVGDPSDPTDTDGDGDPDYQDNDSDGDGIPDGYGSYEEAFDDCDGDDIPDFQDADQCLEAQVIPEGISPNGDGVGDTWVIDFLIEYPNASVTIMNRWGTPVFKAQPYLHDFA